ncbi:MAG TPA: ADOP family duplicated permease [Vicinamibacterales bacterium]|nr:ADOP family duplicated permease [Vicinamibacterales bacterium]
MTPPRVAQWLLDRCLDRDTAEAVIGDLSEGFMQRASTQPLSARLWFWRQTAASIGTRLFRVRRRSPHPRSSLLSGIGQDVRFALRSLRGAPGFSIAAIATLAIGIGASTAIGTAATRALIRPLPYPTGNRLVSLGHPSESGSVSNVGFATVVDWRARLKSFDELAIIRGWTPTLVTADGASQVRAMRVNWNYFRMLGVQPAMGRDFVAADDDPDHMRVVIISDGLWRRQFQSRPDIVGQSITFNSRAFQIVGVMPASYEPLISTHFFARAEVWAPLGYALGGDSSCRSCRHLKVLGRLREGTSLPLALAELATVQAAIRREHPSDYTEGAPVAISLQDALTGSIRRPLQVLLGAVLFVLLVSSANVAGLLMARATAREREFAVRSALGAGWVRIVRQLVTESMVLATAAVVLGLVLARWGLTLLAEYAPITLPRLDRATADPALILIAIGTAALALIIFGLLPALFSARSNIESVMRATQQAGHARAMTAREWLMAGQVAIALLFVAGAGLMYRTVDRLLHVDAGFNAHNVLSMGVSLVGPAWAEDAAVRTFQNDLLQRVRAMAGVESAALAGQIPLGGNMDRWGFHIEGRTYPSEADAPDAERFSVTPGYFQVMGIPLRAGRLINDADSTDGAKVLLVNETAARTLWPEGSPIGAGVRIGSKTNPLRTVVGVVGDVRHYELGVPAKPQMYLPQQQQTDSFLVLVVRSTNDPAGLAAPIRRVVTELGRDVPVYDVKTLDERLEASVASRTFLLFLLGLFALTTLVMAAVGLYGVVSQSVGARRREFGIRLALGAARRDISWLVMRRGLLFVALGIMAGLFASMTLGRALGTQLYETAPTDPVTLGGAVAVLFGIGLLAHIGPLRRATKVDPVVALRNQ